MGTSPGCENSVARRLSLLSQCHSQGETEVSLTFILPTVTSRPLSPVLVHRYSPFPADVGGIGSPLVSRSSGMRTRGGQRSIVLQDWSRLHDSFEKGIGLAGFEPAASSSRTKRSTKLSHSPWKGGATLGAGSGAVNGSFPNIFGVARLGEGAGFAGVPGLPAFAQGGQGGRGLVCAGRGWAAQRVQQGWLHPAGWKRCGPPRRLRAGNPEWPLRGELLIVSGTEAAAHGTSGGRCLEGESRSRFRFRDGPRVYSGGDGPQGTVLHSFLAPPRRWRERLRFLERKEEPRASGSERRT